MNSGLFASADWLRAVNNHGYGLLPIPTSRDAEITKLLRSWLGLEEPARSAALLQVKDEYCGTLLAYSERMASLAVRDGRIEHVVLGLVALGLDGWRGEWRESCIIVALHFDAGKRIGQSPDVVFEEAARVLPPIPAEALRSFLLRSEEDKSLEAMGYVTGTDSDGFRYVRTW